MSPAAPPARTRQSGTRPRRSRLAGLFLVLAALAAPAPAAAQLVIERVELTVRIEPRFQALYTKAKYLFRNRSYQDIDTFEFEFPASLAARVTLNTVWDRGGELPWRLDPAEEGATRLLLVALRAPLEPRKSLIVVVSYDLALEGFEAADKSLFVSPDGARLPTTGWYPLPAGSAQALPEALRLAVRLPREWPVEAPAKLKRISDGTLLAAYELELPHLRPDQLLFRAGVGLPP